MSNGSTTWSYTYDANGMRTSRSNGSTTYTYVYNGTQLVQMTKGSDTLYFTYGISGPTTVTWNGTTYYYALNAQGDVIGILDGGGNGVVLYNWDNAWGYHPQPEGPMADTLGTLNPLRYRSYVYDEETGLYYLQTRYYNPEIGRFINADALVSTGQGLLGNNMFAYCGNNPLSFRDDSGNIPTPTILKISAAGVQDYSGTLGTYNELKKLVKGNPLYEVHHLIEQRFYVVKGVRTYYGKPGHAPCVILRKENHRVYTNSARENFPYGTKYTAIDVNAIKNFYQAEYGGKTDWLDYMASYFN
jgi:RHS repeat-associated protein